MKPKIKDLFDSDIIKCCKDCIVWRETGIIPPTSILKHLVLSNQQIDPKEIERQLMEEALIRFRDIASIIFKEFPKEFII